MTINVLAMEEGPGFGGALMSLKYLLDFSDQSKYLFFLISNYEQEYIRAGGGIKDVTSIPRMRIYGKDKIFEQRLSTIFGDKAGPLAYVIDRFTYCRSYMNKVSRYIQDKNIDIVHLNNWPLLNDGGLFAAKKNNIPVVMHVRGLEYGGKLVAWIAKQADHIIAISDYVRDQILQMGISEDKVSVIYNAVDVEAFAVSADIEMFRNEVALPVDVPIIGIAGCLVDWKGHKYFLEACAKIFQFSQAQGIIIGDAPNGEQNFKNELMRYANDLGILDRIHFVGHRNDIASAMGACDILVHASTRPEPFGRVIIEAMALAKPVIATEPGGPSEIISHGKDGILVSPSNSDAIADAVIKVLADNNLRGYLGNNAKKKVMSNFRVEKYVDQVADIYEKVLFYKKKL